MINAVGRDIPDEILKQTGKEVFQGVHHFDGYTYKKHGPMTKCVINSEGSKVVESLRDALLRCGIRDGMTLGFHHHFREGDYIVNMVMEEIHKLGVKDITICASSLGKAHDPIVPYIEDGTITHIQSSGVRGKIGEAISNGKLKGLAIMRSHGGRVRAIETGETVIDIAFIGVTRFDQETGFTCESLEDALLKRTVIERTKKIIVLMDSSKIGVKCSFSFCGLNDIDIIVSDGKLPEEFLDECRKYGVEVL